MADTCFINSSKQLHISQTRLELPTLFLYYQNKAFKKCCNCNCNTRQIQYNHCRNCRCGFSTVTMQVLYTLNPNTHTRKKNHMTSLSHFSLHQSNRAMSSPYTLGQNLYRSRSFTHVSNFIPMQFIIELFFLKKSLNHMWIAAYRCVRLYHITLSLCARI